MAEHDFLSVKALTELSIKRSKLYSSLMQKILEVKDGPDFDIGDLSDACQDDTKDDDFLADMESDRENEENLDAIKELSKCTHLGRNLTSNNLSETLYHSSLNDHTRHEIQTIFDETLPVLDAFHRKCEESGLEKILNSFDNKKIDDELRHNDLDNINEFNGISPIAIKPKFKKYTTKASSGDFFRCKQDETSSEESMQSVDTARYIKSSRKHYKNSSKHGTNRSPTNTMTIKTYRLVKSKRDALREKYACSEDNNDDDDDDEEEEINENEFEEHLQQLRRQRLKRKQILTMSAGPYRHHHYDHDDEYFHYPKSNCRSHCSWSTSKKQKQTVRRLNYYTPCSCSGCRQKSVPVHCHSGRSVRAASCRNGRFKLPEIREVMRESECSCCDDDTLCDNTIHLADVSTDEWIVENVYSPRKLKLKSCSRLPLHCNNKKYDNLKKYKKSKLLNEFLDTPLCHKIIHSQDMSGICPLSSTKLPASTVKRQHDDTTIKLFQEKNTCELEPHNKMSAYRSTGNDENAKLAEIEELSYNKFIDVDMVLSSNTSAQKRRKSNTTTTTTITKTTTTTAATYNEEPVCKLKPMESAQENTINKITKVKQVLEVEKSEVIEENEESESFLAELALAIKESNKLYIQTQKNIEKDKKKKKPEDNNNKVKSVKDVKLVASKDDKTIIAQGNKEREERLPEEIVHSKSITSTNKKNLPVKDLKKDKKLVASKDDKTITAKVEKQEEQLLPEESQSITSSNKKKLLVKDVKKDKKLVASKDDKTTTTKGKQKEEEQRLPEKSVHRKSITSSNKKNLPVKDMKKDKKLVESKDDKTTTTKGEKKEEDENRLPEESVHSKSFKSSNKKIIHEKTITTKGQERETIIDLCDTPNQSVDGETVSEMPREILSPKDPNNDSTIVTSTTGNLTTPETRKTSAKCRSPEKIVIYNTSIRESIGSQSLENGQFVLTEDHLSKYIGAEMAIKFLKYHIGRRQFDVNSTVYFCPPKSSDETESDDDELELFGKYGRLIVSKK